MTPEPKKFSPEELIKMAQNWRRDHKEKLYECRLEPNGINPKSCEKRQLRAKRVYADGSLNVRYLQCSGHPDGSPCPHWLSDAEYKQRAYPPNWGAAKGPAPL